MDGDQQRMIIELTHGRGLLDARALWATIVGPHRLAMSITRSVRLRTDDPVEIAKNIGSADAFVFVGVALPVNAPINPLRVIAGPGDSLGFNNSAPQILTAQMGGGAFAPTGFMQLLQPGEQLYMLINDVAFPAGTEQGVIVATVTF
jgi:hypothetical protein